MHRPASTCPAPRRSRSRPAPQSRSPRPSPVTSWCGPATSGSTRAATRSSTRGAPRAPSPSGPSGATPPSSPSADRTPLRHSARGSFDQRSGLLLRAEAAVSADRGKQLGAGLLTATTGVRADLAMLVHAGVLLTLLGTGPARRLARLEQCTVEGDVLACLTGQYSAGGLADVGAVLVQANALGQIRHHVLGQAGVRAGGTGLSALEAGLDAFGELLLVDHAEVLRVGLKH